MPVARLYPTKEAAVQAASDYMARVRANGQVTSYQAVGDDGIGINWETWALNSMGIPGYRISLGLGTFSSPESLYLPALICPFHRDYIADISGIINARPQGSLKWCIRCYNTCRNCGMLFKITERVQENRQPICRPCSLRFSYCENHHSYYPRAENAVCDYCAEMENSWEIISVSAKETEEIKKITASSLAKKKPKEAKEVLYRPMCRRVGDYRILDIIDKVGLLPVQICLIGGSRDFMGTADIMVSSDIRLPNHPLTKNVVVSPQMNEDLNMPYTIALSRPIRESNSSMKVVISWIREFK